VSDSSSRHHRGFYEAAWLGYLVATLSIVFGASQVAPDGWRRTTTASLLLIAAAAGTAGYRFRKVRLALGVIGAAALVVALPVALLPSSAKRDATAGPDPTINMPNSGPSFVEPLSPTPSLSGLPLLPSSLPGSPPAPSKPITATVVIGRATTVV
jgi:hypothetical protein